MNEERVLFVDPFVPRDKVNVMYSSVRGEGDGSVGGASSSAGVLEGGRQNHNIKRQMRDEDDNQNVMPYNKENIVNGTQIIKKRKSEPKELEKSSQVDRLRRQLFELKLRELERKVAAGAGTEEEEMVVNELRDLGYSDVLRQIENKEFKKGKLSYDSRLKYVSWSFGEVGEFLSTEEDIEELCCPYQKAVRMVQEHKNLESFSDDWEFYMCGDQYSEERRCYHGPFYRVGEQSTLFGTTNNVLERYNKHLMNKSTYRFFWHRVELRVRALKLVDELKGVNE